MDMLSYYTSSLSWSKSPFDLGVFCRWFLHANILSFMKSRHGLAVPLYQCWSLCFMRFASWRLEWGEPYSGKGTDTFILSNGGNRLTQLSCMEFQDQSKNCTYRQDVHLRDKQTSENRKLFTLPHGPVPIATQKCRISLFICMLSILLSHCPCL